MTQTYNSRFNKTIRKARLHCPVRCSTLTFKGEVVEEIKTKDNPRHVEIFFWFTSNTTQVHQEYLVYDTVGLIGSIGGSLGLFIGFSFHGALISILVFIKNILIRSKLLS